MTAAGGAVEAPMGRTNLG